MCIRRNRYVDGVHLHNFRIVEKDPDNLHSQLKALMLNIENFQKFQNLNFLHISVALL